MTRWNIKSTGLDERTADYTATFTCTNTETGESVDLTLRQNKGCPATDLVGACKALAQLFHRVDRNESDDDSNTVRLN